MNTFPTISTAPKREGFIDVKNEEAVAIAGFNSGYPLINVDCIFDSRNFTHVLRHVSQADKITVMSFYQSNKDVTFYWLNEQDRIIYEVIFVGKPRCQLDGEKDEWRIGLRLEQAFI